MTTPETLLHTTLTGHEIRHQPSPAARAFLGRLAAMVDDPRATENDMIALGYSRENPLLAAPPEGVLGDRGYVTREVLEDPSYRVMTDLLTRKRVAQHGVDVQELAAGYHLTVADAAQQLGVTESAVRQAIAAGRLDSWVKSGRHFLHPHSLEAFNRTSTLARAQQAGRQGAAAAAPVRVHIGHKAGASMKLRYPGELAGASKVSRDEVSGALPAWSRVAVMTTEGRSARLFVLEPAPGADEQIEHEGFFVRGPFRVAEKINNTREARAAWEAFEAS